MKPKYLQIYWLPTGDRIELRFLSKKVDPAVRTHGEGNCMLFELVDEDLTPEFAEALERDELDKIKIFWYRRRGQIDG